MTQENRDYFGESDIVMHEKRFRDRFTRYLKTTRC